MDWATSIAVDITLWFRSFAWASYLFNMGGIAAAAFFGTWAGMKLQGDRDLKNARILRDEGIVLAREERQNAEKREAERAFDQVKQQVERIMIDVEYAIWNADQRQYYALPDYTLEEIPGRIIGIFDPGQREAITDIRAALKAAREENIASRGFASKSNGDPDADNWDKARRSLEEVRSCANIVKAVFIDRVLDYLQD